MNEERPNILLLMCDQLRADSLGAAGHPLVRTPNIDRLAASGVQFTRAYTESPVCVPAPDQCPHRAALVAGRRLRQRPRPPRTPSRRSAPC